MASRIGSDTSLPITDADCSTCLASVVSRSMRAASTAWTLPGTWTASSGFASRRAPGSPRRAWVSTSARTLSSRKSGLPSVRATSMALSGSSAGWVPSRVSSRVRAIAGGNGSIRIWA